MTPTGRRIESASVRFRENHGPTGRRKWTRVRFYVCRDPLVAQIWVTDASGADARRTGDVSTRSRARSSQAPPVSETLKVSLPWPNPF